MSITITTPYNKGDYPSTESFKFNSVWELQECDNELIIKFHDHSMVKFSKSEIVSVEVELV